MGLAAAAAAIISRNQGVETGLNAQVPALVLMAVSLIYFILACLFAESIHRINDPAKYIHQHLRPQFRKLTDVTLWDWEEHLASQRRGRPHGSRFQQASHRMLDHIRWVALIVPIAFVLLTFWEFALFRTRLGVTAFIVSGVTFIFSIVVRLHTREGLDVVPDMAETLDELHLLRSE